MPPLERIPPPLMSTPLWPNVLNTMPQIIISCAAASRSQHSATCMKGTIPAKSAESLMRCASPPRQLAPRHLTKITRRRKHPPAQKFAANQVANLVGPVRPGALTDAQRIARGVILGAAEVVHAEED